MAKDGTPEELGVKCPKIYYTNCLCGDDSCYQLVLPFAQKGNGSDPLIHVPFD